MNKNSFFAATFLLLGSVAFSLNAKVVADSLGVEKSVATSPASLLKGEVSGVRVSSLDGSSNGSLNVNIRGLNTLRGDSQPLWIVDGVVISSVQNRNLNAFYQTGGKNTKDQVLPDYSGCSYTSPVNSFSWLNPYEIESIEVIKDMSAAAIYGLSGANGVIIVTTNHPKPGESNINWTSNVSADLSEESGDAYRLGITHNHQISIGGATASGASYNISGFARQSIGAVKGMDSLNGGLAVGFESKSNQHFWFGLNSFIGVGNMNSMPGVTYIGSPSLSVVSRYPDSFSYDNVEGFLKDYDDLNKEYRTVNSAYARINIIPGLYLKASGGLDAENATRHIWYGDATTFGHNFKGAAALLNNNLFNYNAKVELNFKRNFFGKDSFEAEIGYETVGYANQQNTMNGTDFELPYLRALGLTSANSRKSIRKFNSSYNTMGLFAFAKWNHNGIFGLDAAIRMDKTARYDSKFNFFPAANGFFDVAKLLDNSSAVSTLKISGGYGAAGREYALPMELTPYYLANIPAYNPAAINFYDGLNRLISKEYNAGINLGLVRDRFNIGVKYYSKTTDDAFDFFCFGKTVGESTLWQYTSNFQSIQSRTTTILNSGIEADVDLVIVDGKNVRWTVWGTFAWNQNSVSAIDPLDETLTGIVGGAYTAGCALDKPVASAVGYAKDETGAISPDLSILCSTIPEMIGSLGTNLSVGGFDFSAKLSAAGGFNLINANKLIESGLGYISSDDVEKADFIRLDRVSASYRIPFRAKWIESLRINLSAHNLFTLTKYSGFNPDVNSYGLYARTNGVDYGAFPSCRSIVLGVSVNF